MSITPDFIHDEITAQSYEISLHADDARLADSLTIAQLEHALSVCQIIEHYPMILAEKVAWPLGSPLRRPQFMLYVGRIAQDI